MEVNMDERTYIVDLLEEAFYSVNDNNDLEENL